MTGQSRSFEWKLPGDGGEASVSLSTAPDNGTIIHDSFTDYGQRKHVCQNMPVETAREMAQWILDNTEAPRPVHPDWENIPVGAEFGYFENKEEADKWRAKHPDDGLPYVKTGESSYSYGYEHRPYPPEPERRGIYAPRNKTLQEQFAALKIGDRFVLEGSIYVREKISADRYLNTKLGVEGAIVSAPEKSLTKVD